jgi:dTDP-4-amino-4,6-dideoxygalactose transaminase/UDP-3-O-[3-hydroxymyristoyl] glucosamine N-acyltransferase
MKTKHQFPGHGISPTARIYPNVQFGKNVVIEDFCLIGYPPDGFGPGELPTTVGDNTRIRSNSTIYAGCAIGSNCRISHGVFIREHTRLGNNTSIGINCVIEHHCTLGDNVRMQGQAGFAEHTIVEDSAWIGPRVLTSNVYHPTCLRAKECLAGPIIRKGAIVGGNVFLCPDIEVGERAFIGAGSVVTKSVEDGVIMFGVPAKKVGVVDNITCPYDLMGGTSPYVAQDKQSAPAIPLVDLSAQHQQHKQEIRLSIDRVILNGQFVNGREVAEFEKQFAAFCGAKHAVGVNSGTDGLFLALTALGIGAGDEVITSPHSFIATASAILRTGARPIFVDIDEGSYTIDPNAIEPAISKRTRAIVPVHLYGHPADMPAILAIAAKHDLRVVEDAAQAHGAQIQERNVGQWGDAACFSFFPGKNLGAYGDAGAIVTDDADLATRLGALRNHGRFTKYSSEFVGINSRLDTLQAAILMAKLRHLAKWNDARRKAARYYLDELRNLPLDLPTVGCSCVHVFHLFVVRSVHRDQLSRYLSDKGVTTGIHYPLPLHLQPALSFLGHRAGDFPVAERSAKEVLSLPMYPELTPEKLAYVARTVREFHASL